MDTTYDFPHRTYIRSNTATTMRLLWFLSALLLVIVVGLCIFVAFGHNSDSQYYWDDAGKFYYTVADNQATLVKFADQNAENFTVPACVTNNGYDYPITTIGQHAFTNHRKLKLVSIADSVTKIQGDAENKVGAFSNCVALTQVNLGEGLANIEQFAFKNCLALQTVDLPSSIQFVGNQAFQNCLSLEKIVLNSNGVLGSNCFADCPNVTTLELARDVVISDRTGEVFAGLSKLTHFKADNHVSYQVTSGGDCLLKTTENLKDTVVLGGYGAGVPNGVTQICDWAWGKRAGIKFFIPANVTKIGAHSLDCVSILTDATAQPINWLTNIPVKTGAVLITFKAHGNEQTAYACLDADGKPEIDYYDLFADLDTPMPFKMWDSVTGGVCNAIFESDAPTSNLSLLETEITKAETYIADSSVRLMFTFDFWEEFKMHYYRALAIKNDASTTYQYEVDGLCARLHSDTEQIEAVLSDNTSSINQAILTSQNWRDGLEDLVQRIESLETVDISGSVSASVREQLNLKTEEAKSLIANNIIMPDTGNNAWRSLRDMFENLTVNVGVDSELNQAIIACENLHSQRNQYTKISWQKMESQLALARQMSENNLSISTVRKNLIAARENLRDVTFAERFACLDAWLSFCLDLPRIQYESYEYDRMIIEVRCIVSDAENLTNNTKVNTALSNIQSRYHNLVPVDDTTVYQTSSTGIFNLKTLPYFIVAAVLFSGAVLAGAAAATMKKQLSQTRE